MEGQKERKRTCKQNALHGPAHKKQCNTDMHSSQGIHKHHEITASGLTLSLPPNVSFSLCLSHTSL